MIFEYITNFFKRRRRKTFPQMFFTPSSYSYKDLHILIVDDSSVCRKMTKYLLKGIGYKFIYEVENGYDCIQKIKTHNFDVIIMDDEMLGISGRETVYILRQNGFYKLIIGLTGDHRKEVLYNFIENGANYVFNKPLSIEIFQDIIKKYFIFLPENDFNYNYNLHKIYLKNKIIPNDSLLSTETRNSSTKTQRILQKLFPIVCSST